MTLNFILVLQRYLHRCSVIFVLVYFFVLVFVFVLPIIFRFSFRFSFASYFLVLVSFQFYNIGDFYKYVMMYITSHQHILLNGVLYAGNFVE